VAAGARPLHRGVGFQRPAGSDRVRDLQRRLRRLGYRPGRADGRFGPRTEGAVRWFEIKHGFKPDGRADRAVLRHLRARSERRAGDLAAAGTAGPAAAGSRIVRPATAAGTRAATGTAGPGASETGATSRAAPLRVDTGTSSSASTTILADAPPRLDRDVVDGFIVVVILLGGAVLVFSALRTRRTSPPPPRAAGGAR
jgi:peptidoglycan hydrolase-like protein with peptidoglycan-binding domain